MEYVASCKAASSPLFFNEYYHLKIEEPMKLLPAQSLWKNMNTNLDQVKLMGWHNRLAPHATISKNILAQ